MALVTAAITNEEEFPPHIAFKLVIDPAAFGLGSTVTTKVLLVVFVEEKLSLTVTVMVAVPEVPGAGVKNKVPVVLGFVYETEMFELGKIVALDEVAVTETV